MLRRLFGVLALAMIFGGTSTMLTGCGSGAQTGGQPATALEDPELEEQASLTPP